MSQESGAAHGGFMARRDALEALAAIMSIALFATQGQAESAASSPSVYIEVQADGQHCVVRKVSMPCPEVLEHLRQVLKLAPGTWVGFRAGRSAPFEAIKKVMDDVSHSEYTTSAAYVPPPRVPIRRQSAPGDRRRGDMRMSW